MGKSRKYTAKDNGRVNVNRRDDGRLELTVKFILDPEKYTPTRSNSGNTKLLGNVSLPPIRNGGLNMSIDPDELGLPLDSLFGLSASVYVK